MLFRVARADHFGRGTEDAIRREFPAGETFLERMDELDVEETGVRDVVLGRHLIGRGFQPSPWFGTVLAACRDVQDETGWTDPDRILEQGLLRTNAGETEGGVSDPDQGKNL